VRHAITRVDGRRQGPEEGVETVGVGGVERGVAPRANVDRGSPEAVGVAAGEDDVGAFGAGEPGRLEADTGTVSGSAHPW
jgi:hypothetical protein